MTADWYSIKETDTMEWGDLAAQIDNRGITRFNAPLDAWFYRTGSEITGSIPMRFVITNICLSDTTWIEGNTLS